MSNDDLFLGENWGLDTKTARELYPQTVAIRERLGITDSHTHLSARQIVENEQFPDFISAILRNRDPRWANYDHYLGQALSAAPGGISHAELLQGAGYDPKGIWTRAAALYPNFAANHAYTWGHLELRRTFGINDIVNAGSAAKIWDAATERLKSDDLRPRGLLRRANVKVLCTTDDPLDNLEWNIKAQAELKNGPLVLPSFRPDQTVNIYKPTWLAYVKRLVGETGNELSLHGVVKALKARHDFFAEAGCRLTDHGLNGAFGRAIDESRAEEIFTRAVAGGKVSDADCADWASYLMDHFAAWNKARGMVLLVHYGVYRNANTYITNTFGPDLGADVMPRSLSCAQDICPLLSKYCGRGDGSDLKVIINPIDPGAYPEIITLTRAFAGVNQMAPWWFSDTHMMMSQQIEYHLEHGFVSSYFGMVCDGRKLTSLKPRFEMYDRSVCTAVGHLVERGIVPRSVADSMVHKLVYGNQARLMGFPENEPIVVAH